MLYLLVPMAHMLQCIVTLATSLQDPDRPCQAPVWQLRSPENLGVCGRGDPEAPPLKALSSPWQSEEVHLCTICHLQAAEVTEAAAVHLKRQQTFNPTSNAVNSQVPIFTSAAFCFIALYLLSHFCFWAIIYSFLLLSSETVCCAILYVSSSSSIIKSQRCEGGNGDVCVTYHKKYSCVSSTVYVAMVSLL